MKKCLCILLSIVLLASCFPVFALAEETPEIPEGYTPIYTKDDLDNIRLDMSGKYILMNDIIFTDEDYAPGGDFYNSGKGWSPIGTSSLYFSGEFDGNSFGIYNLNINSPTESGVGLFGYASNAVIKNIIVSGSIIAAGNCGFILGRGGSNTLLLEKCSATGTISCSGNQVGGIVGFAYSDRSTVTITDCYFDGTVSGANMVGGIAGTLKTGGGYGKITIIGCLSCGSVSGVDSVGGIAGYSKTEYATESGVWNQTISVVHQIKKNENRASVSGDTKIGGLVGYLLGYRQAYSSMTGGSYNLQSSFSVYNCFNRGSVCATSDMAGGLFGYVNGASMNSYTPPTSNIACCYNVGSVSCSQNKGPIIGARGNYFTLSTNEPNYYLDTCIEDATNTLGTEKSEDQLRKKSTFQNWDFETIWTIDNTAEYRFPTLNGTSEFPPIVIPSICTHENTELQNASAATCTENGYTGDLVCLDCGETVEEGTVITALGHDYIDHPAQAATCIAVGWNAYQTCSRCDYTSYEEIDVDDTNHVNTVDVPETFSTCVTPGYTAGVYCNDCKQYIAGHAEKDLAEHTWNEGEVTKEATCSETGIRLYTCTVTGCVETYEEEIQINGTNHKNTTDVPETASTCVTPGYTAGVYCNDCKQYISGHAEKALADHTWNNGEVIKEANCKEKGSVKYTCTVSGCGETKTVETGLAPNNHNYVSVVTPPTCTAQGYTTYTCTRCDNTYKADYVNALGHKYSKTVTPATCTSAGYTTYTCVRGDHTYTADYTEALGHRDNNGDGLCDYGCGTVLTPVNPEQPSSSDNRCNYCGKVHPNNFIGMITSFFHNIAYIFARMFGTR